MKKILFLLIPVLLLLPFLASAHSGEGSLSADNGFMMMEAIEDSVLGNDLHEEMEGLMEKMISGNLSEDGIDRMTEIMNAYPASHAMMMNRMMHSGEGQTSYNMMGGFQKGSFFGSFWISQILLWIFLLLGIASLWKWLQK